jgi:TPR repeat protein
LWDRRDIRGAFGLLLSLAERGVAVAYLNLGYFFDRGLGVQKSEAKALYWYRRAYRNGDASGANNIGTIFRDRGESRRAIAWFSRALKHGEHGSALEIAKIYLNAGKQRARIAKYLKIVLASDRVSESDEEEAARLLKTLARKSPRRGAGR